VTISIANGTLDLAAKVRLLTGGTAFALAAEPAIGLEQVVLSDGPSGVRGPLYNPGAGDAVAAFPNATLVAAAWSEDAAHELGTLLAQEALRQRVHVVLGPTINLHRSLLNGRVFEAYSEDPLLTGRIAAAYVRGLQQHRIGACLKHLIANESETERNTMDSVVDEATLREVYLLPFEIAVQDADPWAIMAAYNLVNGIPATEHDAIVNGIVKGEWGYRGLVMSDWYATTSAAPAARGGLDLVMPGPAGPWGPALTRDVHRGAVDESVVDEHLGRVLTLADRVGAVGETRAWPDDLPAPDAPERRAQITRLAAQGMTVLTNRTLTDRDITGRDAALPLDPTNSVALIGRHAVQTITMGGGSARVTPPHQVSIADGLGAVLGERLTVVDGVEVRARAVAESAPYLRNPVTGAPGTHARFYGPDGALLAERHSRSAVTLVNLGLELDDQVYSIDIEADVDHPGGPVEIGAIGAGNWAISPELSFTLRNSGTGFAEEIMAPPADSVVLSMPGPFRLRGTVTLATPAGTSRRERGADPDAPPRTLRAMGAFGLTARPAPRPVAEVLAQAAAAAAAADVAVVVVGLTDEQETESVDKTTLRLPGEQDALVAAVAAVARRTVVLVNAATPVVMPWRDKVDAIVVIGLPGQEAGHAVAAALFGEIEPAGRLVSSWPVDDGQAPAWSVTPVDGALEYTEGPFIGYRGHHAKLAPAAAFWFGHGLGYGQWDYRDAVSLDPLGAEVTVTNTGYRPSREVVQLYLDPQMTGQPSRLVGWAAVSAAPGESVRVRVHADPRACRRWDDGWHPLTSGRLLLARGLGDVRAELDVPR
jgi:beta-glucosidase